jgi:hypothetical protein
MRIILLCFSFLTIFSLQAASVKLMNDSPYKLRAVVRANDGTYLGEMIVNPQQGQTWSDAYGRTGQISQPTASQSPYSVLWYCMNGDDYSFCDNVASGSMITAQSCSGPRLCKPEKKEKPKSPYESQTGEIINPNASGND